MVTGHSRGHKIVYDGQFWRYQDTGKKMSDKRPCKLCGLPPTKRGYDACLGHIKGCGGACCGHGRVVGYVTMIHKRRKGGAS
jgi:hypothetical protein